MACQPSGAPSGKHHEGVADPQCVWSQTPDLRAVSGRCGRLHAEAPTYKYTGQPLARWTITGDGQVVNYAKPVDNRSPTRLIERPDVLQ